MTDRIDTPATEPDLKPCPFCGGEAVIYTCDDVHQIFCRTKDCAGWDGVILLYDTQQKAITAWNTRAPVTVKPLVWETPNGDENTAATKCGRYVIEYHARDHQTMFRMVLMAAAQGQSPTKRWAATMAEAKAAAQADYERRILAALTPDAAPQVQACDTKTPETAPQAGLSDTGAPQDGVSAFVEQDLRKRVEAAEAANELDRYRVVLALYALDKAMTAHGHLLDGRGAYEWDDDAYRKQFSQWFWDVQKASAAFKIIARDWHGCPVNREAILAAIIPAAPQAQEGTHD